VRVIAGSLGGRQFESPGSFKTHPMGDKVRGALFNILGDIEGLTVLDAFAGSGALSFEAISRGAVSAIAIDNDRAAQRIITANIRALRLGRQVKLISASANAWLQTNQDAQFDIVLCDPPYNDLQPNLVLRLAATTKREGIFVLSWPGSEDTPAIPGFIQVELRNYGDAQLAFYRLDAAKNTSENILPEEIES
jgi:16S rRNA (guanine966-N2)-methyltransferase